MPPKIVLACALLVNLKSAINFKLGPRHTESQSRQMTVFPRELGLHLNRQTVRNSQNEAGGSNQSTGCATTQEEKFKYPTLRDFIVLFWTPVQSNLSDYTVPWKQYPCNITGRANRKYINVWKIQFWWKQSACTFTGCAIGQACNKLAGLTVRYVWKY